MDFCEMMLLFLLAFLLFGPKKIPEIARQMGHVVAQLKSASSDLQAKLGLEAALPPQAVSEAGVEAQWQIIVGELQPMAANPTTSADTASVAVSAANIEQPKSHEESYV